MDKVQFLIIQFTESVFKSSSSTSKAAVFGKWTVIQVSSSLLSCLAPAKEESHSPFCPLYERCLQTTSDTSAHPQPLPVEDQKTLSEVPDQLHKNSFSLLQFAHDNYFPKHLLHAAERLRELACMGAPSSRMCNFMRILRLQMLLGSFWPLMTLLGDY